MERSIRENGEIEGYGTYTDSTGELGRVELDRVGKLHISVEINI